MTTACTDRPGAVVKGRLVRSTLRRDGVLLVVEQPGGQTCSALVPPAEAGRVRVGQCVKVRAVRMKVAQGVYQDVTRVSTVVEPWA